MAVNNILVAYDGSELADKALEMALDIARLDESIHVDIVHVVPIPLFTGLEAENLRDIIDLMMEDGEKIIYKAQDKLSEISGQINTMLLKGTAPATELLKLIDANDYDLIIIGSRGLSGIREYMGSVSYKVLHKAKKPVLVMQ